MMIQAKIQKWGNSLALRLTGPLKTIPHFEADMIVNVDVSEGGLQISPAKKHRKKLMFTESELLKGLTSYKAHADEIAVITDIERGE